MDKVCAVIVFLSVYQLAGMLHYHDAPVLEKSQLVHACNSFGYGTGLGRLCR